jgi:GDP-mannose 6-dehydrogenase
MNISIVGLGYVGTVSAACLASKGHLVWGVDINRDKIRIINEGDSPIVENGLADKVAQARRAGLLHATGDIKEALQETEICFVAVATPSRPNGQLDPAHLLRACEQIAHALVKLGRSQVVVVRSSVLPSELKHCEAVCNTIAPGKIKLCVNPEFLREGTAIRDFENPPFTLLGVEEPAVEVVLKSLYDDFNSPIYVLPPQEALLVKYASNVYHALKVAFANEIGILCQSAGIDGHAVMSMFCRDKHLNISARYLMPGFAFGGSCLPKDLRAVLHLARQSDLDLPLINALFASNEKVIERAVHQVIAAGARRVGLIGLSFKPNTDDLRESPYVEIAERLLGKGCELKVYDPNVSLTRLTGANKDYIDRVIPHLSHLLVPSLADLADSELVIVGHKYTGVAAFLDDADALVVDLTGQHPRPTSKEEGSWSLSATF